MENIKLKSRDGWFFPVTTGMACQSKKFRDMLKASSYLNPIYKIIPINCRGRTLEKIMKWCDYHQDDPIMDMGDRFDYMLRTGIPPWDVEFFKVDIAVVFEIYIVARHLEMEQLIHHSQQIYCDMERGKTLDEGYQIHAFINENLRSNASAA